MKPTTCPSCNLAKRGFWETEYDTACADCREKEDREDKENRLREAVKSGKIKVSQLNSLGLSILSRS